MKSRDNWIHKYGILTLVLPSWTRLLIDKAEGLRSKGNIDPAKDFLAKLDNSIKDQIMQESMEKMSNELQTVNLGLINVETATNSSASNPLCNRSTLPLQQSNQVTDKKHVQVGFPNLLIRCPTIWWNRPTGLDLQDKSIFPIPSNTHRSTDHHCVVSHGWSSTILVPVDAKQQLNYFLAKSIALFTSRFGHPQFDDPQFQTNTNNNCDRLSDSSRNVVQSHCWLSANAVLAFLSLV